MTLGLGSPDNRVGLRGDPNPAVVSEAEIRTLRDTAYYVESPRYGARGDSTTDDTAAIQRALNAADTTNGRVVLRQGATYLLSGSGSTRSFPSVGATQYEYALSIPSGVTLDLNGATLKLAAGETTTVMVCNSANTNTDIGIVGYGTLDGSDVANSNSCLVWLEGVTRLALDIKLKDSYRLGLYCIDCAEVTAPRIHSDGGTGIPVYLGSKTTRPITDSQFGSIISRNVVADPANPVTLPGNSVYVVMQDSHIESIQNYNAEGGVKIDDSSQDLTIGTVIGDEGPTTNSGLKFQGNGTTPLRVQVGQVHMKNMDGEGLYMEQCVDCSVGQYTGRNNGRDGANADVWVGGKRDSIGSINSFGCGFVSVLFRDTADDAQLGQVIVTDPNQSATASTSAVQVGDATGHIESLVMNDSEGNVIRALSYGDTDAVVTVGQLKSTGHSSQTWQPAGAKLWATNFVRGTTEWLRVIATDDALPVIGSSATIGLDGNTDVISISGTTNITSVSATYPGHRVTLIFQGVLTFTDGSNLKLNGDFVTSADDAITLVCNGTNWYETSRSAN